MIWLAWRQFRGQAVVVFSVVVAVAIIAVITGPHMAQVHDAYLAACKKVGNCDNTTDPVTTMYRGLQDALPPLLLLLPVLIGMFWGAPLLARELEIGTYRLVWTQSVSRRRWLMVKLGMVVLAATSAAGLLSLIVTWWASSLDAAQPNRFGVAMFGLRGVVPIGYAAFAVASGVVIGVIVRRVLPAMAGTLVVYIFARLAVGVWVRPYLMRAVRRTFSLLSPDAGLGFNLNAASGSVTLIANPPAITNGWVLSSQVVNNSGQSPTPRFLARTCPNLPGISGSPVGPVGRGVRASPAPGAPAAFQECITKLASSFHELVVYQPASRFWGFQGLETALFCVLALALGALTLWWVRHRVA